MDPWPRPTSKRNLRVFVVSIILIIGGLFLGFRLLLAVGQAISAVPSKTATIMGLLLLGLLPVALGIGVGIMGAAYADQPRKAQLLINVAIGWIVLDAILIAFDFAKGEGTYWDFVGFVLPALFLWGALSLRKQRDQQSAANSEDG